MQGLCQTKEPWSEIVGKFKYFGVAQQHVAQWVGQATEH